MNVIGVYNRLLKQFGPQGWWPIFVNKGLLYHIPYSKLEKYRAPFRDPYFEIAVGAILTQNINWKNVARAIELLYKEKALTPEVIVKMSFKKLDKLLYCARYHEQKAKKLKIFSKWIIDEFGGDIRKMRECKISTKDRSAFGEGDLRLRLLGLWGIGRETADSIILYALNKPIFVIDEYTRRLCKKYRVEFKDYDDYKNYFEKKLALRYNSLTPKSLTKLYQEFHALIVRRGQDN